MKEGRELEFLEQTTNDKLKKKKKPNTYWSLELKAPNML